MLYNSNGTKVSSFRECTSNTTEVMPLDREILTLEEAAELFGVSIKTFIKLLKEEKVPARKIGREWRFSRKALIDWLSSGDSKAYSASEGDAREFFNEIAPDWEEMRKNYYDESIREKILESGLLKKEMTVLDLGAGNGYVSRAVAGHVGKVIAVDISGEMLKELKKKAREDGIGNIEILENDGLDMTLENESVDMVFASMYLHHIEEPQDAIKEMYRVLKPGGFVFLADFCEHKDTEMKEKMHDAWPGFNTDEVKKWFNKRRFRNINVETLRYAAGKKGYKSKADIFVLLAEK